MVLWLHLREAVRALRLAVEQPLPQALLVEGRAAARQALLFFLLSQFWGPLLFRAAAPRQPAMFGLTHSI